MFTLYQKREKNFPAYVRVRGDSGDSRNSGGLNDIIDINDIIEINADFRNILRIFAVLTDDGIPEIKRIDKLIQWFYIDPPWEICGTYRQMVILIQAFADFVNPEMCGGHDEDDRENLKNSMGKQRFCYDFDAEEIYAGFLSEYGIDLTETEFMHWYKFRILLSNLSGGSAFKKKIELRFMDLSHLTGEILADMTIAKEAVQIPDKYAEAEEFESIWDKAGINTKNQESRTKNKKLKIKNKKKGGD